MDYLTEFFVFTITGNISNYDQVDPSTKYFFYQGEIDTSISSLGEK
jgi:hypothetical protein